MKNCIFFIGFLFFCNLVSGDRFKIPSEEAKIPKRHVLVAFDEGQIQSDFNDFEKSLHHHICQEMNTKNNQSSFSTKTSIVYVGYTDYTKSFSKQSKQNNNMNYFPLMTLNGASQDDLKTEVMELKRFLTDIDKASFFKLKNAAPAWDNDFKSSRCQKVYPNNDFVATLYLCYVDEDEIQ